MKRLPAPFFFLILISAAALFIFSCGGCSAPSTRVNQVKTLKVIGASVDASMQLAGQLYKDHRITQPQAQQIADFHQQKFQKAYRLAVDAVKANLDTVASPEIVSLAAQLAALIQSFQNP